VTHRVTGIRQTLNQYFEQFKNRSAVSMPDASRPVMYAVHIVQRITEVNNTTIIMCTVHNLPVNGEKQSTVHNNSQTRCQTTRKTYLLQLSHAAAAKLFIYQHLEFSRHQSHRPRHTF